MIFYWASSNNFAVCSAYPSIKLLMILTHPLKSPSCPKKDSMTLLFAWDNGLYRGVVTMLHIL